MKDRASYRSGFGFGSLSSLSLIVLGVVSSVAIARVYGIKVIGQFGLSMAPSMALMYLSTAQEQAALVRRVAVLPPREPEVSGLFAAVMTFSFVLTAVVGLITEGVIVVVYHGPIDHPDLILPATVLVVSQTLLTNTCWNLDMVLSAFRAGRELFWVRLNQAVGFLVLAVAGGLLMGDVWGLVMATCASWAFSLLHRLFSVRGYMRFRVPRHVVRHGFRSLPEMIRFGIKLAPSGLASGVASQVGTWVLGAVASLSVVGAYQRAWQLTNRFLEAKTRIGEVLLPTLVERRAGDDSGGFDRALVDSMRYLAIAMFFPAAVGGGAGYGVMELFGPGFSQAGNTLAVLLAIPALAAISGVQAQVLIAEGRPGVVTTTSVGRTLLTIGLTFAMAPSLGMMGAALAWAIGSVVGVIWLQHVVRPHLAAPLRATWTPVQMAALGLACAAGFGVARVLDHALGGPGGLLLALTAGSLAYGVVFLLAGGVAARDRERFTSVFGALRGRLARRPSPSAASGPPPAPRRRARASATRP
ncbi:MAG: lipopolysaccharide biosynthesis protein [Thermoleophilaceae bacterium]